MDGGEDHGEASPGAVIGDRYVLEELIGRGGMADVYRARDRHLDRTVAVKVFRPGGEPEGARRLVAEARLLAPLDHPGVVALSDGGVDEYRPFLVMPLVTGGTLADRLVSGPLPVPEVTRLGRGLAGALAYLHGHGIVHRDVKPSNVLLDEDGRPLLGDFDVSRFVGSTRLTSTGEIIGTAAYLAPEQVRGLGAGPAADVYALGLMLLECLTGHPVYAGTDQISIATARLLREPDVPGELPAELRAVLA
ncbi:MAG: serine/threonine protein kinase, partial [Acidothermales bacterium]|nr:serine/threonine protein kinase [Acidothermales bacterium]